MVFSLHERRQVGALTRAFLVRFFENEITAGTDDLKMSFFWLLSFLAVPGFLIPFSMSFSWQLLVMVHGTDALREMTRGDKALYLGFAMTATSAISAIAWNSLLADRRDGLVLGVLPVRAGVIVTARLSALGLYVLLVAVGMNALASGSFGLSLGVGNTLAFVLRGTVAHFVASVSACACVFLWVAGIQGVALAGLGPRLFARLAPLMQVGLVAIVVAGFLLLPVIDISVGSTLAGKGAAVRPWILFLPPLWFLGLYEVVLGTTHPVLIALAWRAAFALGAGALMALCTYPLAYRRVMVSIVQQDSGSRAWSPLLAAARLLTRATGRTADIRAVSQFFLATVGRVERHRFIMAAAVGIVVAWVLPGSIGVLSSRPVAPRIPLLSLPLAAMVFLVGGLRIAASLPSDVRAAWIFDISPPRRGRARATIERTMIAFGVVPVALLFAPLYQNLWGWEVALSHTAVTIAMGVLLVEILLFGFHAMPCARSWNPQGARLDRLWGAYLIGFVVFTVGVSSHELGLFGDIVGIATFVAAILASAWVVRIFSLRKPVVEIDDSAFAPGDVLSLN